MVRAGVIAPLRPDKYLRIGAAMARENMGITSGFASAAQRCPDRPGLVDELGTLTWRDIDQRADAFAAALQALPGGAPSVVAIMARNHRGFVESLIAANRIGADVLLLNTSFAGPALAEVVDRESKDASIAVVYDEEFTSTVDRALADNPDAVRIVAWTDTPDHDLTVETMIGEHFGEQPSRAEHQVQGDPADLRHDGNPQGRQPLRRQPDDAQGHSRPHPVAGRGGHGRRRSDVPRLGLRAVGVRRVDGVHGRHPAQVRPGGHPQAGRPASCHRIVRRPRHVRPDHGTARGRARASTAAGRFGSPPPRVRGCAPTSSSPSWTASATSSTTTTTRPRRA